MSDGRASITFAPAAGIQETPESAGHGSGDTIVVSAGPAAASQQSDAGADQAMGARASSRSRVLRWVESASFGRERSYPPQRGSPSDPRNADQQLDDELRKARRTTELQMSEAAEQHALKAECPLQRILGLERMNHTRESQVAHVHGRMRDECNLTMEQLKVKASRLSEIEATAFDFNNETQQLRTESSEISASLRKAAESTSEYQSMMNTGAGHRTRLSHVNEQLREAMKQEEKEVRNSTATT